MGRQIELRGVRVHNLKDIDLDIPHGQLLAICGLSGSGKTSLALDTLYAEGQRRYIESFSAYTRQFLDQLEKPDADRIDGIPPAVAITASRRSGTNRTTVGTVTETIDFLRLLYSKIATIVCPDCGLAVNRDSPQTVVNQIGELSGAPRFQIAFPLEFENAAELPARLAEARRDGFRRVILNHETVELDNRVVQRATEFAVGNSDGSEVHCIVDRLKRTDLDSASGATRCVDSLEAAFRHGGGRAAVLVESEPSTYSLPAGEKPKPGSIRLKIDDRWFDLYRFSNRQMCDGCGRIFPPRQPTLFSFNSPRGACRECEGFGKVQRMDLGKIVPDDSRTVRDGAIAPWNSPAYRHELEELIELADDFSFPLDIPFRELQAQHLDLLWKGVSERDFGGLDGFFSWLERRKYKMHLRVFLSRWRSFETCPECSGLRLNSDALAFRVGNRTIAELSEMSVERLVEFLNSHLELNHSDSELGASVLRQLTERLQYLCDVGVGYLSLERTLQTLSAGERQRVALTRALGTTLVNLLYVLDEPSNGLHPKDIGPLVAQIGRLKERRNTVVMVEHNSTMIRGVQRIVEIGPGAGARGGNVVFDGTPDEIQLDKNSITGQFLAGQRGFSFSSERRPARRGVVKLIGARGNNLKNLTVEFPLGMLCVVTGVSGSGKSSLVQQTLGPALLNKLENGNFEPLDFEDILGVGSVNQVVVIDQSALQRSSRSNPVTYVKAFDEIRKVFSETVDAKTRNLKPGHFSFNVEGGRCETCAGEGYLTIDMQFMPDVLRRCDDCQGTRFKTEVLQARYRQRNIAEILEMTVAEAFKFFRGHKKVQAKLKLLKDVGLDYLHLGQPASTLSTGEAQRLKLALYLGASAKKRTLFIMDEPTAGLHMADVLRLVDCFDSLIGVGHSMIVVEHNLQMMLHADHIIDLGPGASTAGGQVVATGTPEQISENPASGTGQFLKDVFAELLQ